MSSQEYENKLNRLVKLKIVPLVALLISSSVFIFTVYVAFQLCDYCLLNPHSISTGYFPWQKIPSDNPLNPYWNIDGKYAFYSLIGMLVSSTAYFRSIRKSILFVTLTVFLYEFALVFFDPKDLYSHATNFQMNYQIISGITNFQLLILSAALVPIMIFANLVIIKLHRANRGRRIHFSQNP
ncbi:MAG: hypothetical protein JRN20_03770 [Nitrososphaerota archaeon]|nr:hypothetical protein [Nitrososphaerota archaeon]